MSAAELNVWRFGVEVIENFGDWVYHLHLTWSIYAEKHLLKFEKIRLANSRNQCSRRSICLALHRDKLQYFHRLCDSDYVKGVVCLAKGLRKVQAAYPLVVAVLPDVPEEHRNLLVNQGCLIREIDPVLPPVGNKESPYARAYFAVNYCKLRLWKFVEYEKMVYLDADIQVFRNIDNLFDLPSGCLYAVVDCLCEMDGQPCAEAVLWPKELGQKPPFYFNAGLFVLEPSLRTYNRLLTTLSVTPPTPFAEQDFLNFFFSHISKAIHPIYNLLVPMLWRHPEYVELDQVKVVHYCVAGSKPWMYTGKDQHMDRADVKMLIDRWWDIYNDATLDPAGN